MPDIPESSSSSFKEQKNIKNSSSSSVNPGGGSSFVAPEGDNSSLKPSSSDLLGSLGSHKENNLSKPVTSSKQLRADILKKSINSLRRNNSKNPVLERAAFSLRSYDSEFDLVEFDITKLDSLSAMQFKFIASEITLVDLESYSKELNAQIGSAPSTRVSNEDSRQIELVAQENNINGLMLDYQDFSKKIGDEFLDNIHADVALEASKFHERYQLEYSPLISEEQIAKIQIALKQDESLRNNPELENLEVKYKQEQEKLKSYSSHLDEIFEFHTKDQKSRKRTYTVSSRIDRLSIPEGDVASKRYKAHYCQVKISEFQLELDQISKELDELSDQTIGTYASRDSDKVSKIKDAAKQRNDLLERQEKIKRKMSIAQEFLTKIQKEKNVEYALFNQNINNAFYARLRETKDKLTINHLVFKEELKLKIKRLDDFFDQNPYVISFKEQQQKILQSLKEKRAKTTKELEIKELDKKIQEQENKIKNAKEIIIDSLKEKKSFSNNEKELLKIAFITKQSEDMFNYLTDYASRHATLQTMRYNQQYYKISEESLKNNSWFQKSAQVCWDSTAKFKMLEGASWVGASTKLAEAASVSSVIATTSWVASTVIGALNTFSSESKKSICEHLKDAIPKPEEKVLSYNFAVDDQAKEIASQGVGNFNLSRETLGEKISSRISHIGNQTKRFALGGAATGILGGTDIKKTIKNKIIAPFLMKFSKKSNQEVKDKKDNIAEEEYIAVLNNQENGRRFKELEKDFVADVNRVITGTANENKTLDKNKSHLQRLEERRNRVEKNPVIGK